VEYYTAQQVAELLQREDSQMNLRTVRYYTQIGVIPPLELVGNKRAYTDRHLHYFRAILTLSKSGETLADIRARLKDRPIEEIVKLGEKLPFYRTESMLDFDTHIVNEDILISMSARIEPEMKRRILEAVQHLAMEGDAK